MGACFHLKRYGLTQFAKGSRLWILGAENVVLVLDNAAIHTDALVEWLWHHHKNFFFSCHLDHLSGTQLRLYGDCLFVAKLESYQLMLLAIIRNDNINARVAADILNDVT